MKRCTKVLVVCHDAGGARSLIPVVHALGQQAVLVQAVVAGPSIPIWRNECTAGTAIEVADLITVPEAMRLLEACHTDTVLSAAGLYNRMEHTFRLAARRLGRRSLAVLDSWLNYAERFRREMNGVTQQCQPDVVCVMDDFSYEGMLAAGFTPQQLVVTGPPNLEATVRWCRAARPEQRHQWRAACGFSADDLVMTFFSEPFVIGPHGKHFEGPGALVGPDGRSLFGYTSGEILGAVIEELQGVCQDLCRPCKMIVKPHPAEYAECLRSLIEDTRSPWVELSIRSDGNAAQWIVMADVCIGMMTIALLEAALAGKPSLSVQLGLLESGADDPCLGNLFGYTMPIYHRTTLTDALRHACSNRVQELLPSPRYRLPVEGAAARVADVILTYDVTS